MKTVELTGIGAMAMADRGDPTIENDGDVLLKLNRVGVCGSDVHYYVTGRIGSQVVDYPFVVGHECSATVVEVGCGVDRVKVGDRVVVDPAQPCFKCDQCLQGRENTCRKLIFLGCPGQSDGCLCEYIVMPQESLFPVDDRVSLDQAALVEPLSIGVYAVQQSQLDASKTIAILGCGPIGLSVLLAAQVKGVQTIYASDKIDERIKVAASQRGVKFVANANGGDVSEAILKKCPGGVDVVFECAGEPSAIDDAVNLLKPGGTLMLIGIPREERISFEIDKMRRRELTVINVRRQNGCVQETIDLIAEGKIDADFMITHRFGLDTTQEAFDLVDEYRDGVIKAMIDF